MMTDRYCESCIYENLSEKSEPCASCIEEAEKGNGVCSKLVPKPSCSSPDSTLPNHYPDSRHGDVISLCLNGDIGFCEGNIIKYVTRWRKKNGLEDLKKAEQYLKRLIRYYRDKEVTND